MAPNCVKQGGFSAAAEDQKWRFACISETNPRKLISEFTVIAPFKLHTVVGPLHRGHNARIPFINKVYGGEAPSIP